MVSLVTTVAYLQHVSGSPQYTAKNEASIATHCLVVKDAFSSVAADAGPHGVHLNLVSALRVHLHPNMTPPFKLSANHTLLGCGFSQEVG